MADQRHDAAFIVGAVVGGLAAGAYALVAAPQAGSETRVQLAERRDALAERLAQTTAEAEGQIRRLLARTQEQTAPLLDRVTALARRGDAGVGPSVPGSVTDTEPFTTVSTPPATDSGGADAQVTVGTGPHLIVEETQPADRDR